MRNQNDNPYQYKAMGIFALICISAMLLPLQGFAQPPPIPSDYCGFVLVGVEPAPDGALVFATVEDYTSGKVSVSNGDYNYLMVAPPSTTYIGKTIEFWVDLDGAGPQPAEKALETSTFAQGTSYTGFGLSIAGIQDTNPPSAPGDVQCITPPIDDTPSFTWTAATDNETAVTGYNVTIPGIVPETDVGNVLEWTSPILPVGNYTFQVSAYDLASNLGPPGEVEFEILAADTAKPVISDPQPAPGSTTGATPEISCIATDAESGINETTILLSLNTSTVAHSFDTVTGKISYTPAALVEAVYIVDVWVEDLAGNNATLTWSFTVVLGDTEPPSKVTDLTVTDAKDGKLSLTWKAATDNVAVSHYKIYRDNVLLTTTTVLSYLDTGLTNGQSYTYQVSAVDTSDNEGEKSDSVSGTPTETYIPPTLEARVAALETRMSSLESIVNGLRTSVSSLQGSVSSLTTDLNSAETEINQLDARLNSLEEDFAAIDIAQIEALTATVAELGANLSRIELRILLLEATDTQLNSTIEILRAEIKALEDRIDETGAEAVEELQKAVAGLQDSLIILEDAQGTIQTEIASLTAKQISTETKLTEIDAKVASLESEVTDLKKRMSSVEAKASAASAGATQALSRVKDVKDTVQGLEGTLTTLSGEIDSLKAKDSALVTDLASVKATAESALAKAKGIESSVTAIQTDLASLLSEVESLKTSVTPLKDIPDKLAELESQIDALDSANEKNSQDIASLDGSVETVSTDIKDLQGRVDEAEERGTGVGIAIAALIIGLIALILAGLNYLKTGKEVSG